MKKIYALLLVAAGTVLSATAQPFQKGDKLLGGSLNFGLSRSTYYYPATSTPSQNYDIKNFFFGISPALGFFTSPNRVSGFSLSFGYGKAVTDYNTDSRKIYSFGASFFRQYWNSLGKNFYFNIQGSAGAFYSKSYYPYPTITDETKGGNAVFSISPGFAYRMKRRLILDAYYTNFLSLDFSYNERRGNNGLFSRNYGASVISGLRNFSLGDVVLGFRYLL